MGPSQIQMWLFRCVDRIYGTTCWAKNQHAIQRSRQVGAERWASLEHEHPVKLTYFLPAVLAAGAREVPCRCRLASCQCGRCLAGARSGFRQGCERHHNECQGRGQQRKRRARGGFHRGNQTQTAGYLVPRVCCGGHCVCSAVSGSGVAHASYHGGGDYMFGFSSSARVCPLDGFVLCALANVGRPHRRHGVVRG